MSAFAIRDRLNQRKKAKKEVEYAEDSYHYFRSNYPSSNPEIQKNLANAEIAEKEGLLEIYHQKMLGEKLASHFWMMKTPELANLNSSIKLNTAARQQVLVLQFGGAVGTLAALGTQGPAVARALAEELKLELPSLPWHAQRDRFAEVATTVGLLVGTLGKIARDVSLMSQTEVGEALEADGTRQRRLLHAASQTQSGRVCSGSRGGDPGPGASFDDARRDAPGA